MKENDISKANQRKNFFSEWLETLQQESWQLELLISGLLLYGILNGSSYLIEFDKFVEVNVASEGVGRFLARPIYTFAVTAWGIFLINFLTHIVLRGFWIGAIGLRYISGEIEYDDLHYSKVFTDHLEKRVGRFDEYIEKLEKACSVIFAFSFLLLFIFLSFLCFIMHIGLLGTLFSKLSSGSDGFGMVGGFVIFVYCILGFLVFLDFITLGLFKKIKDRIVSRIYFCIYLYFSYTTLSFLYRPLLYNFLDNRYTKRLILFSIPYYFLLLTTPFLDSNSNPFFPYKYQRDANKSEIASIDKNSIHYYHYVDQMQAAQSSFTVLSDAELVIQEAAINTYIQDSPYLELFIRQNADDISYLKKDKKINPIYKTGILHPIMGAIEKDTIYKSIEEKQRNDLKILKSQKSNFTAEEYRSKLDSLAKVDNIEMNNFKTEKILNTKQAFVNSVKISIDNQSYDSLAICRYYIHNNAKEKGILCHIPISQLSEGDHLLHIKKRDSEAKNRRYNENVYIPFIKIN